MPLETISSTYEFLDTLSSSGDSDVSVIRHRQSGEQFILKYLKDRQSGETSGAERKLRFKREMDIVSSLDHPNIAKPVFSLGSKDIDSIAYPYRKGKTLSSLIAARPLVPLSEALHIARQLLDALDYVHCRGIIHGDINPNNLFIDDDKGLQLLDFGMAMTDDEAAQMPEGKVSGTLPWLSPEQMGFTAFKMDARSDLYCAALVLYRMLAGKLPFALKTSTVEELLGLAVRVAVEPLHKVPLPINAMLLKALKPTPADRYQTAAGFKLDVLETIGHCKNETSAQFIAGRHDAVIAANRVRLFIARGREVETLKDGLRLLLRGVPASFCIHGKSGMGKTEIVREFRRGVAEDRCLFLSVKCNSFSPQQPYSIFRHLALDAIAKVNAGGKTAVDAFAVAVDQQLADYSGVICKIVPEMRAFFREVRPIDVVEPDKEADRTAHVLFTFIAALCSFKPALLFIDDVQWIDRVSFEIIRRLLRNATRCMIVTTLRTDNLDGELLVYESDLRRTGIQKFLPVMSFSRAEIRDLIVSRFGDMADMERLADFLAAKTDCSPFALAEALRFLVGNAIMATSGNEWWFSESAADRLPEKLDPLALILQKTADLAPDEQAWLETASLAEGRFTLSLVDDAGGFLPKRSSAIVERLENCGVICPQIGGDFRFVHDRIQESVRAGVSRERKFVLYEKFGAAFETKADANREFLLNAADAYLKSKNIAKAIALCYAAARYAVDQGALDVASRYFSKTQLMATQSAKIGVAPPIDTVAMEIGFGDVLMLTGRNEQALHIFEKLLKGKDAIEKITRLEIKYKIGTIFHTMGNFEASIKTFFDALQDLGIKFYSNKILIVVTLLWEMLKQAALSMGVKALIAKKDTVDKKLSVKILNKLSYSLFFKNILLVQHAHFKALNIADGLVDCAEKSEAYAYHIVSAFLMLMKKRAFLYFNKSLTIANNVNRRDMLAFAHSFGGVTYYYNGRWKEAEKNLNKSIEIYKSIGDRWGQIVPLETLVFTELMKGHFSKIEPILIKLKTLDEDCKDQRGLAAIHTFSSFIKLVNGRDSYLDWATLIENRDTLLNNVPLNKVHCNFIILNKYLFNNQLKDAYDLSDSILDSIKQNNLIQEYVAGAFSDRCEILVQEFRNRIPGEATFGQLPLSNRALLKELRKFMRLALLRGVMYPAHRGAAYRALAWYHAFKKHPLVARYFFHKAISHHHRLDMKYEEARSLRDYALFFEGRHHPGLARDHFNRAYVLFEQCGAFLECDRIRDKVNKELVKIREPEQEKNETSTVTNEAADQIRVDALYDASLSLTQSDDIGTLLRRIVGLLIRATGAHYGYLRLEGDDRNEPLEIALDYDDRTLDRASIVLSDGIMQRAIAERRVVRWPDPAKPGEGRDPAIGREGSALCVPVLRGNRYLGCAYLANRLVAGLFSDNAVKAAQIIAGQAGFLIENARLMGEYKGLAAHLEEKVKEQTRAVSDKNDQFLAANLRLIESERMKDLLSGTIVHDIKNFAAGISGHLKLIAYRHGADPKTMRNLDLAGESCGDIVTLASNLLDISKMDEGKLAPQQRRMHFEELAAIAAKYGRNVLFDEKKITVTITPPRYEFAVIADPYLVERVVQNIFSNAAKYTEAGGTLELTFAGEASENVVTFFSSGAAVPDDSKEIIFEKFSRIDNKNSHYSKGLGLFFCKMVMTAHQGRIWLDTDEKGNYFRLGFKKI